MDFDTSSERLSERQLKFSEWWVNHKVLIYRIAIGIFAAVDLALVGYGAYGFFDWLLGSGVGERARYSELSAQLIDYASFRNQHFAQDLVIEDTVSIPDNGTLNYFTVMTNSNNEWWASFDYSYTNGAESTEEYKGFILPGETKHLHALGSLSEIGAGAAIEIKNLQWHRVNNHIVRPDYQTWSAERLNMQVTNTAFTSPNPLDAVKISRVSFNVKNDAAFGFKRVGFFVSILSGGRPLAVNYITISDLHAGESRQVDVSWVGDVGFVGQVIVEPEVNIFDSSVYLAPGE